MGYTGSVTTHLTRIALFITIFGLVSVTEAQEVPMSQYYVSPLNINPALVGSSDHPFVTAHHRSQWSTFSNAYPISLASAIFPIIQQYPRPFTQGGLGVMVSREVAGVQGWLTNTGIRVAGAYNLPLDYHQLHVLSFGVAAGYYGRRMDPTTIQWGSQYNPSVGYDPSIDPSVNLLRYQVGYASVEAGVMWSYKVFKNRLLNPWQWLSGVAISQLNRPNISFTDQARRVPIMVKWHGGASYTRNHWRVHPQAIVLWQQERYHVNVGAYTQYRIAYYGPQHYQTLLLGGLWYRWSDAVAVSGGIKHRNLQFALSVDFSQHPTLNYMSTRETWEASIVYTILKRDSMTKRRYTPLI